MKLAGSEETSHHTPECIDNPRFRHITAEADRESDTFDQRRRTSPSDPSTLPCPAKVSREVHAKALGQDGPAKRL